MRKWEFLWRNWNNLRNKREKYQFSQFAHQTDFGRPPSSTDYRITPRILVWTENFTEQPPRVEPVIYRLLGERANRSAKPSALSEMVRNRYYVPNILQTLKNDQNDLKWTKKSNFDLKKCSKELRNLKKRWKKVVQIGADLNPDCLNAKRDC